VNSPSADLVGLGLNATDTLISISDFPGPGSKANVHSLRVMPGGQVATAVIACRYWGIRTSYIGKLGDDPAAEIHRSAFRETGVETHIITVPKCSSAHSHILVDGQGERSVLWHRDPRLAIEPQELHREWFVNARALLVDGCDTAAATQAAKWTRDAGASVIADLDEVYPNVEKLLETIDYLIVSRDLPARISGQQELQTALQWLQSRFGSRLAAATLGTDGVLAWDGKRFFHAAAFRVPAVDTTGAGDIFHAGFIYGLLQSWPLERVLDFACAAAALNCTAAGARGNIAAIEKIHELVARGDRHPTLITYR
jgi:sulfofructose kinase